MCGVGQKSSLCIAAILAACSVAYGDAAPRPSQAQLTLLDGGAAPERFLFFAGTDLWRNSGTLYGGMLWSPEGLAHDGLTLKLLYAGGFYGYRSGTTAVLGAHDMVAVLPGWRFSRGRFEGTVYGGLDLQYHRTLPLDPGNRLDGGHAGLRIGADLWWEPHQHWMVTSSFSVSSVGNGYGVRLAAGRRFMDHFWVGPEIEMSGDSVYRQWRIGAHVTAVRFWFGEWTVGIGLVQDSDRREGIYGRLGVLIRH